MEVTPIDAAFAEQEAAPEAEGPRLRFHERVLDSELFLLLDAEPEGTRLRPRIFDLEEGRFVLAFDRDDRLAAFLDGPAPYAALAGRRLVEMLAGQGIGIGLNLGETPSATLMTAEAVLWMNGLVASAPVEASGAARRIAAPREAPPELIAALDPKLATMAEVIGAAYLVTAEYAGGRGGLLLALVDVPEAAQAAVARAIAEAVRFCGLDEARLDVTFLGAESGSLAAFRREGLAFELPRIAVPEPKAPVAPGMDPARPPILRR